MLTLNEISKQAYKLYNEFVNNYMNNQDNTGDTASIDNIFINDIDSTTTDDNLETLEDLIPYTDDYDLTYLDETARKSGHYDEQILLNRFDATDENGNYVYPMYTEIN